MSYKPVTELEAANNLLQAICKRVGCEDPIEILDAIDDLIDSYADSDDQ